MTEPVRGEVPWPSDPSRSSRRRGGTPVAPWAEDRSWTRYAKCTEDPELFFPEQATSWKIPRAKAICAKCPVTKLCRDLVDKLERRSTSRENLYGIWAGENVADRIRRRLEERLYAESTPQLSY